MILEVPVHVPLVASLKVAVLTLNLRQGVEAHVAGIAPLFMAHVAALCAAVEPPLQMYSFLMLLDVDSASGLEGTAGALEDLLLNMHPDLSCDCWGCSLGDLPRGFIVHLFLVDNIAMPLKFLWLLGCILTERAIMNADPIAVNVPPVGQKLSWPFGHQIAFGTRVGPSACSSLLA